LGLVSLAAATVYFEEKFNDGNKWQDRWVESKFKGENAGEWKLSAGKFGGEEDKGLQTAQDARFYQLSAAVKEFSNEGKKLIVQYAVKHEQNIDCGGGYLKVLPTGLDQTNFNGDSDYNIMFGPDICGATKKVHVIFNHKGKNHLINKDISCENDEYDHLYTLIVNPDATYEVKIDNASKQKGSLKEDWDMLLPRKINDPSASKPADWDDHAQIDDPNDVKPADWDSIPAQIADPDASKPDDWDTELDGDWEAPKIDNPKYKGAWKPKQIANPAYKGSWVHPQIDNPDFKDDDSLGQYASNKFVGIEVWQVKSGTIFSRFLVTDDEKKADDAAEKFVAAQKLSKEKAEKQKADDRAKAEEDAKKHADEDHDDHDHDHDDHGHGDEL